MSQTTVPPVQSASAPASRLGTVVGDRMCINCGFNLHGQTIEREPHYNMVIVRCPECSTVAALQEYPVLGKWAGRWSHAMALAWMLALIGGLIITAFWVSEAARSMAESSVRPLALTVAKEYRQFSIEQAKFQAISNPTSAPWLPQMEAAAVDTNYPVDWNWLMKDHSDLLDKAGGLATSLDLSRLRGEIGVALGLILLGMIWAVAAPHVKRRHMWLAGLIAGGAGSIVWIVGAATVKTGGPMWGGMMMMYAMGPMGMYSGYSTSSTAAVDMLGWPVAAGALAAAGLLVTLGMLFGRPVARLTVRGMLSPRMRAPFGILWSCDGLPMPRVK